MGTSNIEISILKKRLELLEMKIGELNSINPEILNERLAKICLLYTTDAADE